MVTESQLTMDEKYPHKCLRCSYEWNSVIPNTKRCPRCNSTKWNIKKIRCWERELYKGE
jgi:predicted Zn-ribbon and HTH transcriptional regulator